MRQLSDGRVHEYIVRYAVGAFDPWKYDCLKETCFSKHCNAVIRMTTFQANILYMTGLSLELNQYVFVTEQYVPSYFHLDRIDKPYLSDLDDWFDVVGDGAGVEIFVLDSKPRESHVDFGGRVEVVFDVVNDGALESASHGSHVTGLIAGTRTGVAKNARVKAIKTLSNDGSGTSDGIVDALDFIAENKETVHPIINMSLGSPLGTTTSPLMFYEVLINDLTASGAIFFVAAGNRGGDACLTTPARLPSVITVGATAFESDGRAYYSNYGPCVDFYLPGTSTVSVSNTGDNDLGIMQGTSMSTPIAAGIAALHQQRFSGQLDRESMFDVMYKYSVLIDGMRHPFAFNGSDFNTTPVVTSDSGRDYLSTEILLILIIFIYYQLYGYL